MVCAVRERSSQLLEGAPGSVNTAGSEQEIRLVGDLTVGQV